MLIFAVMMLCVPSLIFAGAKDRLEKSYGFERGGRVNLQNVAGDIFVKGWGKDQVEITAMHAGGPKRDLNEVVHITQTNGNIRITTSSDKSFTLFGSTRTTVHYELLVPDSTHLKVETVSGNAEIRDFGGALEVKSVSGDIRIIKAKSSVKCKTISGDINLKHVVGDTELVTTSGDLTVQDLKGSFDAESVSGDMVLKKMIGNEDIKTTSGEIAVQNLKGSFEAASVSGDMDIESFSKAEKIEIETVSGDISMEGILDPNGSYTLTSHSGDIGLKISKRSDFELQTGTTSGDVACDFALKVYGEIDGKQLQGIVGKGGANLYISTYSGDIRVRK